MAYTIQRRSKIVKILIICSIVFFLTCNSAYFLTSAGAFGLFKQNFQKPVWTETKTHQNQNTRSWQVSKWVQHKDPLTNKMETVELKSKIVQKGRPLQKPKLFSRDKQITESTQNITLTQNEVWYADTTYYISDNIIIPEGVELKIEPGTIIKFENGKYIDARLGKLTALGAPYEYIIFTTKYDSAMGDIIDSNAPPSPGCWSGLYLSADDAVSFCKIGYADYAIDLLWQGSADGKIQNNIFYNSYSAALIALADYDAQGTYSINNNLLYNDSTNYGYGIYFSAYNFDDANISITNNTISKYSFGLYCEGYEQFRVLNNLFSDCGQSLFLENGVPSNNAFYNVSAYGVNTITCTVNPFDTSNPYLGSYFLNNSPGGGLLLKNAGYSKTADYYDTPQNFSAFNVADDSTSARVFTTFQTILSKDTFWYPSENYDMGIVDIGYHHPRIDYFIQPGSQIFLSEKKLTVAPGTIVAIGGQSQSIQCGKIISNGMPYENGRIKYINYALASANWSPIKYQDINNGSVCPANVDSQFSFCDFTGLGYGILSGASNSPFHDNIFKNNYQGLQGNKAFNCLFCGNQIGMYSAFAMDFEAVNCDFDRNTLYGLYIMTNPEINFDVRNCIFTNNATSGIFEYTSRKTASSLNENNNAFYENQNHKIFSKGGRYYYDMLHNSDYSADPYIPSTTQLIAEDFLQPSDWQNFRDRFYLPQYSWLIDAGDSSDDPMNSYTTDLENHTTDDNIRDIGFHYPAEKEYWIKPAPGTLGTGTQTDPFSSIAQIQTNTAAEWDIIHIITDSVTDVNLSLIFENKNWPIRQYYSSAIYRNGIRWTFDTEKKIGQFCNGDFWVLGSVNINSVSPAPLSSSTNFRNGSMLNPIGNIYHSYDGRVDGFQPSTVTYPLILEGLNSLLSSASIISQPTNCAYGYLDVSNYCVHYNYNGDFHSYLYSAACLTSVSYPQLQQTFRPPYSGSQKQFFIKTNLQKDLLPHLPLATRPTVSYLNNITKEFQNVWIDHKNNSTVRLIHPVNNMPNYGREIGTAVSEASCLLTLDYNDTQLDPLLTNFIQTGIDLYYDAKNGTYWGGDAGHDNGRKWPIIFAGLMLNCDEMKNIMQTGKMLGGEDMQTYYNEQYKPLWGRNCYSQYNITCSGTGAKDCMDPNRLIDGCVDYRNCCTSNTWCGEAIAVKIMGAENLWSHNAFFDYIYRWVTADVVGGGEMTGGSYIRNMWNDFWPANAAIIDNGQTGCTSYTGSWSSSASYVPYSTSAFITKNAATYTWTFTPQTTGIYKVSMWWIAGGTSMRDSVPITIQHASGTASVNINQQQNGSQWNQLGELTMVAGNSYNVRITASAGSTYTCADAVMFAFQSTSNTPPTASINSIAPNPSLTGQTVSFSGSGSDSDGTIKSYQWQSNIDGVLSNQASFNTSSLSLGSHQITLTVQDDDNDWSLPVSLTLNVLDYIIDNGDMRTSSTGTWQVSGASGPYGPNSLWSYNGSTYRWTFTPAQTGIYEISMWWTAIVTRTTNAHVLIQYNGGTNDVIVNQTANGGIWNSLGQYPLNAGLPYNVTITASPGSPPSTCADAVRFRRIE